MKRIVTIQDISCLGKCSLTVALPIISALGVEAAVVPTAVLSTHTMFKEGYTFCDLTDEMAPIADHWTREGFTFDAVYTGYLGSQRQLALVADYFDRFGKDGLIVVDPVMADNGKLYTGFSVEFAHEMAKLCGKADLVVPNITEACFMLDIPYRTDFSEAELKEMLVRLTDLGPRYAALTGVSLTEGRLGVLSYDKQTGEYFHYDRPYISVSFHGTGDIFASTTTGALARGMSLEQALTLAVDYTVECMLKTLAEPNYNTYGVNFEQAIPYLITRANEIEQM